MLEKIYTSSKDFIMREYLCNCEECLCLNFLSCVKNTSKFKENKTKDTNDSENCMLDEENNFTKVFESVTITLFVAVISCNTSEPIYFILFIYLFYFHFILR